MEHMAIKRSVSRELWLNYFNRALYRKGTITEREYLSMSRLIRSNG